jgi:hypothetical protein
MAAGAAGHPSIKPGMSAFDSLRTSKLACFERREVRLSLGFGLLPTDEAEDDIAEFLKTSEDCGEHHIQDESEE